MAEPPTADAPDAERTDPAPDSRWWYWVAALPVYYVVGTVVGFIVGVAVFFLALTGVATVEPGMGASMGVGFGFAGVFLFAVLFAGVGLLLSVAFPVAIYYDATAVAEAPGSWNPDPALYGIIGLAGLVAQPLQVPLAVYYLYKRHGAVGVP